MTTMNLHVDEGLCAGHALCTVIAPDLFEMDDRGKAIVIGDVDDATLPDAEDSVKECPAHAILLQQEST